MKALLSVLAIAGYQNRDKIKELLSGLTDDHSSETSRSTDVEQAAPSDAPKELAVGLLNGGGLENLLGGSSPGRIISGGLGDLFDLFMRNGHGEAVNSWVSKHESKPIDNHQLARALGPDVLIELVNKTGLSEHELLNRLSRVLPEAVSDLTPNGKVPEVSSFV